MNILAFFVGSGSRGLCFLVLRAAFHPLGKNKRAWNHVLSIPTKAQKAVRHFFFAFLFFYFFKGTPYLFSHYWFESLRKEFISSLCLMPSSWSTGDRQWLQEQQQMPLCYSAGVIRAAVAGIHLGLLLFMPLNLIYYF